METKRKPSFDALTEGREKRPRRLSNVDLISSPTTSDLFKASDDEAGEAENKRWNEL